MRRAKLLSRRMNIWLLEYETGGMKAAAHSDLLDVTRAHPRILKAQFNHPVTLRATFPNDPGFGNQWGLHNTGQSGGLTDADIDAPEAWDYSTGGVTALGDQVVVAIIDGGFDLNHEDVDYFKNVLETPGNGIDDDGNGYVDDYDGWNAYGSNGNIPNDSHGMHVAGIAGAIGNNGTGVAGVNWGAKIMPIAGSSSLESTVIEAYGYALEMRARYNETDGAEGAFVVSTNASFGVDFGNPANYPLWCGFYDSLGAYGILSAGATANLGIDIDVNGDVPTACPSDYMVSVTNTTRTDNRNNGAAYGLTTIDLGAPGTSIYSTLPGNGYGNLTGTSMATPHVAGAIGLMYAGACPGLLEEYRNDPAGVALQMKQYLLDGTDPIAALNGKTVSGGRLNVFNSIELSRQTGCGVVISHTPLANTKDSINDYEVLCEIVSGASLNPSLTAVHYDINSVVQTVTLNATGGDNEYNAFIPAQSPGTTIDYWIIAEDINGDADTTDTYTFRVINYDALFTPPLSAGIGGELDTVWHDFTVTNNGLYTDEFNLTTSGSAWQVEIFDASGTSVITSTGSLALNATFDFTARVIITGSFFGDVDTALVTATSVGDPSVAVDAIAQTTSTGGPLSIPFADNFVDPSIDIGLWASYPGITISTDGLNEPSEPNAANLDGDPNGADTMTTHIIDLDGLSGLALSYGYQRTGGADAPETGEDLFVEYYNDLGQWMLLEQYLGADPDMTTFATANIALPSDAHHADFQLRFRNTATVGDNDDWFVDDVRIDYPAEASVSPIAISEVLERPESTTVHVSLQNVGQGTLEYDVSLRPKFAPPSAPLSAGARSDYPASWYDLQLNKGIADPRVGTEQSRSTGGPDGFGYIWADSDEPGGPAFAYQNIAATGTVVNGLDDDNSVGPFALEFDFPFYGSDYTDFYIGSNGLIGLGSDAGLDEYTNQPILSGGNPNAVLAWMWDDLDPTITSFANDVYIDSDTSRCIIQFTDYAEYGGGGSVTAQVVLFADGSIEYRYYQFTGNIVLDEATVGLENENGNEGLEVVFNANYLHDILLLRFSSPIQWVSVSPASGLILDGQSEMLSVALKSADLDTGLFYYDIEIYSNDPNPEDNPWIVPVTLRVTDCNCPHQADYETDGVLDAVDLNAAINIIFFSSPDIQDSGCPITRTDFNYDGVADAIDLNALIDHLFFSGEGPCDACNPVQGSCAP
ncbi:MAG: S8 family serine peptidase [candidate division Zixibacteria bacterium]|nr:S8 family serine peptidase [candidate division Zixibacteria bacterium]